MLLVRSGIAPAILLAATALSTAAFAQAPADFYKGKTITIYVGLSAGGGYDTNARLVGRHIGKYIPGSPTVVVRNMPGAGGLVMTNHVAQAAPADGTNIGAPQRGVPFEPLLGQASKAKFDPRTLQWIGSVNSDTSVAMVHTRTGIKTWADLKSRETVIAGTGVGTESVVIPYVLRNLMGLKFKVIAGFPGGNEMNLAMERGEVDGRGTFSWTSIKPHYKDMIESGKYRMLFQMGLRQHQDLKEIPLIVDLADDPETKQILKVQFTAFELGRPLFVAEAVPADRVEILRKAFDLSMKDPDLNSEAIKSDQEVNPMSGAEMAVAFKEV
ncbi:MAG: tripartite tricarboxylate transporter family receptor, partial [Hyphomicrobiales bacterium]|nr:tripartite tricarboxylate transporter family receptor [Hyphomicrobiales bacterium]